MRDAGEKLLRTPSAISQSITGLERSLGIHLFVRSGIRLDLTDTGRRILRHVRESETELKALLEDARAEPARVRGRVTLGMLPGYPAVSLADGLSAALLKFPELQLRVRFLSHAELAEGLLKNDLELALSLQPLRQWNRRIKSREVREENLILVVPPRHRHLCSGEEAELPVVDYYQKPLLIDGWLKHHRLRHVKARVRVFGSNLDHVLQMVFNGIGCAVVPKHVVASELAAGTLLEHYLDRRRPWMVSVWLNTTQRPDQLALGPRSIWNALQR